MQKIDSTGLHAMVLVGVRKNGNGPRYLLQNWWSKKPFVEVDADYLKSSWKLHKIECANFQPTVMIMLSARC